MPNGLNKSVGVTVIGLLTMLWGGIHAAAGVCLFKGGYDMAEALREPDWASRHPELPAEVLGLFPVIAIGGVLFVAIGIALMPLGVLGLLAGSGVLLRKRWGRNLAFIVASLAVLVALASLGIYQRTADASAFLLAFGAVQFLYGIVVFVLLIRNAAEQRCQDPLIKGS